MVIKEYYKGKQLTELEKLKEKIEGLINHTFDYSFKYNIGYRVSLEITPNRRNKDIEKIESDFLKIQSFLIEKKIDFSLTWWGDFIRLSIRDN